MKTFLNILVVASVILLSGCGAAERAAAKLANPVLSDPILVDGCQIKYVDRGHDYKSFYIARCADTTTATSNYTYGKTRRTNTVISKEIEALQVEQSEAKIKEAAINKLTPEEQKALGINK